MPYPKEKYTFFQINAHIETNQTCLSSENTHQTLQKIGQIQSALDYLAVFKQNYVPLGEKIALN